MPLKATNNIQESVIDIVHFKYRLQIKDPRRDDLTPKLLPFEHQSDCSSVDSNFHLLHRLCKTRERQQSTSKSTHVSNKL